MVAPGRISGIRRRHAQHALQAWGRALSERAGDCRPLRALLLAGMLMFSFASVSHANPVTLKAVDIKNNINHQTYRLLISGPQGPAPAAGYPVLYLFDGNVTAPLALQWLAAHGLANDVLVVGIGYPNTKNFNVPRRFQDLTFVEDPKRAGTGQARAFFRFVSGQVRPLIEKRFKTNPGRQILFGHSLGGLAVLRWFVEQPDAFSTYLAASPSLWWAGGAMMRQLQSFVRQDCEYPTGPHRILITVGERERPNAGADEQRNHKLARRHMVGNARSAAELLKSCAGVRTDFQVLRGADHGEALEQGLAVGLTRLFSPESTFAQPMLVGGNRPSPRICRSVLESERG